MKVKKFLIMIPAYNEAETIGKVLDNWKGHDVLVVNDASSDNTREIVESKGFKCISHDKNKGYCCALVTGYQYALEHDYDYVTKQCIKERGDANVCMVKLRRGFRNLSSICLFSKLHPSTPRC